MAINKIILRLEETGDQILADSDDNDADRSVSLKNIWEWVW